MDDCTEGANKGLQKQRAGKSLGGRHFLSFSSTLHDSPAFGPAPYAQLCPCDDPI